MPLSQDADFDSQRRMDNTGTGGVAPAAASQNLLPALVKGAGGGIGLGAKIFCHLQLQRVFVSKLLHFVS
jgi:hypothetical protein